MRRCWLALGCVVMLVLASCAGSDPLDEDASHGGAIDVEGNAPSTSAGDGPADPGTGAVTTVGAGPAGGSPTSGPATEPTTTVSPGTPDRSWQGPPGSYAARLLQPTPARSIVLEVFEQDGAGARSESLSHVRATVAEVSGKPVTLTSAVRVAGGARAWTASDLRSLADEQGEVDRTAERAVVRMLFLRGTFEGNDQVLGVAVRGDVMAVFTERIAASSTVLVPRSTLEKAVTLHEMGHLLGLVGLVVNADRQDPDHPGHSSNRRSVMFWAVESSVVGQVLGGPPATEFDNDDLADLATIRRGG